MKSVLSALILLVTSFFAQAQYYYKDILGTQETNEMMKTYKANKVLLATAIGFDGDGVRNNDFLETYEVSGNRIKFTSRNNGTSTVQYFNFNDKNLLASIIDSSSSLVASTIYSYDDNNKLVSIKNTVSDADDSIYENEQHIWKYNAQGKPEKMYRVVNNNDTTIVKFTLDENGNVIEELPVKRGVAGETIYYYYNEKNQLTDIARYNEKAKRILPDYMFEYSPEGRMIQKLTTLSTRGLGYIIWRYVFDEKGLKTKEASFNRDKVMTGKIEYSYRLAQ